MSQNKQMIATAISGYLKELLAGSAEAESLQNDTDLIAGDLLDSLNIVRLIQFVETEFDFSIDDADITPELFTSANAMADYVIASK